ncbi:MAG TPA: hypothetical protein VFZ06_00960 [Acidimicrobiia bacterium]|nr:hypothetical protein [Acidimicrobiia bacterium]
MNRTSRILAIALAVVLVGAAIYVAYQNGYESGAITAAATGAEDGASTVVVDRGWGHRGYGFGFFPFFWIFPLLFFFLIFSAFRRRGPWGGPGGGDWGSRHEYIEGRFREMHDQAHKDEGQAPPA